ncbi:hypothetical protein AZI86_11430 [Bdellovibrio bacteriovorus]|uniref:DUF4423 domain-containing protein n=1 Tax=Bdellovibrio bacteriovorus TaxID=959 RepID=A0A150WLC6_BDEBC|nr:TIGR02147 family protein [Bdellovibrio bacteriovorus]KYG64809.1 hypothetical protein AZI86_11430 [Bdellovibrio bacteriovorus]
MTQEKVKLPDVFGYLSLLKFLQDYYQARKSAEPGFSYDVWATELGFQSRSYLRMVLIGRKKVSEGFIEKFNGAQGWSQAEASYFSILAKYNQSTLASEKQLYGNKLIQILKSFSERKTVKDAVEFLSKPLYARLLVMLSFEDITPTDTTFARLLGTSVEEINSALQVLESLKLATASNVDTEVHWRPNQTNFDVPDSVGSVPLMHFHKTSLQDSMEAFDQPKDLRRFKSLLLPLSAEEMILFHQMTDEFISQLSARFQSNTYSSRRLFQVNLNVFSVAEPRDKKEAP